MSKYLKKMTQINQISTIFRFRLGLENEEAIGSCSSPTWILRHIRSEELDLVYSGSSEPKPEPMKDMLRLKNMSISLVDFKKIKELYDESDHRQKSAGHRINSKMSLHM